MKKIFNDILASFKDNNEGYSSRKLTAFIVIILVITTHIKWLTLGNLSQLEMVLTIDYGFIAALFGMTTYSAIKLNKDTSKGKSEDVDNNDESNI